MEKELDPAIIKATQISLGKHVKRPPLNEKLLKKPPFRFLHDIVTTVLKATGFFENLFDEEELISDNVKDRDSKISFLNKVIFVLSSTTGKSLGAKPSKIVAGQEPEKTNELLQCLAQALEEKLSSEAAVQKYKESTKPTQILETKSKEPTKTTKKASDFKKLTSRSNEKLSSHKNDVTRSTSKQDKEKANDLKSKKKENGPIKLESQNQKKTLQLKTVMKKNVKEHKDLPKEDSSQTRNKVILSNTNTNEKRININNKDHSGEESNTNILEDKKKCGNEAITPRLEQDDEGKLNSSYTIAENELNSSSSVNDLNEISNIGIGQIKSEENNVNKETSKNINNHSHTNKDLVNDNQKLKTLELGVHIQENLSNQGHDLVVDNEPENKIITAEITFPITTTSDTKLPRPSSVRPSSSRPGAPRMREKIDNVTKETDNLLLGRVNIIIENTQNEEEEETGLNLVIEQQGSPALISPDQQELQLLSSEHGHLVQQILDSQKELSQITGKTEIEWQFGAQKAREAINQEIEQLRFNIQALSRVANPLGKLLDHIQEDVEVMRQELLQWSNIYEDVTKEMFKQKAINEDSLTPFHTKLKQLERDVEEKHDKINDLKILIHKNAFRIEKLLASGNVQ